MICFMRGSSYSYKPSAVLESSEYDTVSNLDPVPGVLTVRGAATDDDIGSEVVSVDRSSYVDNARVQIRH